MRPLRRSYGECLRYPGVAVATSSIPPNQPGGGVALGRTVWPTPAVGRCDTRGNAMPDIVPLGHQEPNFADWRVLFFETHAAAKNFAATHAVKHQQITLWCRHAWRLCYLPKTK